MSFEQRCVNAVLDQVSFCYSGRPTLRWKLQNLKLHWIFVAAEYHDKWR